MAFIRISMCRGIEHACIAHQLMSKGYSYRKQVLSIDNNWKNTEVCLRSGSVRCADTSWSLRRVSWDKEFIPYALNLNIQFISTEPYKAKTSFKGSNVFFRPDFLREPSVLVLGLACHLHSLLFWSRLTGLFQGLAHVGLQSLIPHKVVPNNMVYSATTHGHLRGAFDISKIFASLFNPS